MRKRVIYYADAKGGNPVWEFIFALPPDERDKCFEYIAYLEEMGEQVRRPVGDYLVEKLYELRPKKTRIIYFFLFKDYAVLVHAFRKKTNAVPDREIKLALKRMDDFVLRYQKGQIRLGGSKS
jgi:phage-related protein